MKNNLELEKSSVVANSTMNRERGIANSNSYSKELNINVLELLEKQLLVKNKVNWLDLCTGTGKALIEAAEYFHLHNLADRIAILGIDLVPMFYSFPDKLTNLRLINKSIMELDNNVEYDLITCVHGLHYIGDKLGCVKKIVKWLKPKGLFIANLDLDNIRFVNEKPAVRTIMKYFREHNIEYNSRKHLISCKGKRIIEMPFKYIGADDNAGKNYTGQPVINSYYENNSK